MEKSLIKHGMIWGVKPPIFGNTQILNHPKKTCERVWIDSISPWKWQGNWPRNLASTKLSVTPGSSLWASEIYQAVAHAAFLEKRFRMLIHADHLVGTCDFLTETSKTGISRTKKNRKSGGLSVHNMIIMIITCTQYKYIYIHVYTSMGFGGVTIYASIYIYVYHHIYIYIWIKNPLWIRLWRLSIQSDPRLIPLQRNVQKVEETSKTCMDLVPARIFRSRDFCWHFEPQNHPKTSPQNYRWWWIISKSEGSK